jgi:hypothetical protein
MMDEQISTFVSDLDECMNDGCVWAPSYYPRCVPTAMTVALRGLASVYRVGVLGSHSLILRPLQTYI